MGVELAGPSSLLAWILLFFIGMYIALCFSELISLFPTSGGVYEICKLTYGSFASFITGWLTWIIGNLALTISIPAGLELMYPLDTPFAYVLKFMISVLTVLLFSYLAMRGKDLENRVMVYFTILILFSFLVLVVPMFLDIPALLVNGELASPLDFSHYLPFFVHDGLWENTAFIVSVLFVIMTVLFGLEAVSFLAGEVQDPRKVLPKVFPRAMFVVLLVSLIFVVGSLAILDQETYIESWIFYEDILKVVLHDFGTLIIPIVVFFSGMVYFSEGLGWIIASPRLIFSLAKDKFFPTSFSKLNPRYQTPTHAIAFQLTVLILFLFVNYLIYIFTDEDPFYLFHALFILLSLIPASLLLLSVPLLRKKYPDLERPYKVPFAHSVPYVLVLFFIFMVALWVYYDDSLREFLISLGFILAGIPIYFLLLFYFDPSVYLTIKRSFAPFLRFWEVVTLSPSIRDEIYDKIGSVQDKVVLEFGCGGGTLTLDLAEKVSPHGHVYSIDSVSESVVSLRRKLQASSLVHVTVLHDEHQVNRVHPGVPLVDIVVSVHMLAHIQDLKKVLHEMHALLPEGGRICFKDIRDIFKILPNVGWVADPETVVQIMKEAGFSSSFKLVKGFFWNTLYVYGIKTQELVPLL